MTDGQLYTTHCPSIGGGGDCSLWIQMELVTGKLFSDLSLASDYHRALNLVYGRRHSSTECSD